MSWFKRGGERKSPETSDKSRSDTDPNTCLEVFQNHWKQSWTVMSCQDKKMTTSNGQATPDGVEAVLSNLEQMVTLLVNEDDDGGLPGPILHYVLETELLEKICAWCTINVSAHERLRMQQLKLFELIISQSKQLLLVHKPVIKPLLRLLIDVADSQEMSNGELEFKLVLVLHQICICISQQSLILESFFSTDADHGPARFLIFSLLIPYIHREGPVGQRARDALLLIMTLSARHPHIGQYIANNSDFCPVLATGLSGLYSSLPRRITPPYDDWHAITRDDCVRIPDLQMFLNSLQFSNAVVQVAHPLVRDQLIEFIYSGFLVPVLAPALHQDIPGLPTPLLDTDMFRISREEVMTATAYLDLFIRHVTDPHLLKAVLKFVLKEKYDDVPILDSLLSRISSNTHLSTVTLALFHTLVDLNCEDVMFQLVFRYLVPCTHVMVSQRRSVRDLDLYGKSAEKFLSLRPSCCIQAPAQNPPSIPTPTPLPHIVGMNTTNPAQRRSSSGSGSIILSPSLSNTSNSSEVSLNQQQGETSYFEYLHDARNKLEQSAQASLHWSFHYDGESPPPDSIANASREGSADSSGNGSQKKVEGKKGDDPPPTGYIELGSILKKTDGEGGRGALGGTNNESHVRFDLKPADTSADDSVFLPKEKCNNGAEEESNSGVDPKLYASLQHLESFIEYLDDFDLCSEDEIAASRKSLDESVASLESALKGLAVGNFQRTSSTKEGRELDQSTMSDKSTDSVDVSSLSPISTDATQFTFVSQSEIPLNDLSKLESTKNKTGFEEISMSDVPGEPKITMQKKQPNPEASSFVDISIVPESNSSENEVSLMHSSSEDSKSAVKDIPASGGTSTPANLVTTKKERNVPKDLPSSLRSTMNPMYAISSSSVISPMKHLMSPGDVLSPYKSVLSPADEFPAITPSSPAPKKLKYLNDPPNIGPFLSSLFSRLEAMISNSLYFNLLLTDVLSRLAAYTQPLLRSFLLNHNLVFQPSVKSLIQVLSSLRQKLDSFSVTVKQFDSLVNNARQNLYQREDLLFQTTDQSILGSPYNSPAPQHPVKQRADTIAAGQPIKEKKKVTLSDLIFRRSPGKDKMPGGKNNKKHPQLQRIQVGSGTGYLYFNSAGGSDPTSSAHSLSTWNAVYCALVLDEFLKELAALSQEHSVLHLHVDEGYLSS